MKRLFFLSITALMMLVVVSCEKDKKQDNPLPTTVWAASWTYPVLDVQVPFTSALAFDDEMVSMVISTLDIREDGMPCILHGRSQYRFENASDGGGQVSFTLSFQTTIPLMDLQETTFSGTYNLDSKVLKLQGSNKEGTNLFGINNLEFTNDPKLTTKINPLPATTWTATWTAPTDLPYPVKAFLAFERTSVSLVIAPELKYEGTSVILYGKAPYKFEYPSVTATTGNVSFTISTHSNTIFTLPEITFSGSYNLESDVLELNVSSSESISMFKNDIVFVKD